MNRDYDKGGYKKPPKKYQFQKGKSGNPRGRPKRTDHITFDSIIAKELLRPVTVTEGGKKKRITMFELIANQLTTKAAAGDKNSIKLLLQRITNLSPPQDDDIWTYRITSETERIFENFLRDAEEYNQTKREEDPEQ